MQQAVYGVYKKGQIVFKEPISASDESDVIVVFLNKQTNEPNKHDLTSLFDTLGAWEDSKDANAIIAEIKESRRSRKSDITL